MRVRTTARPGEEVGGGAGGGSCGVRAKMVEEEQAVRVVRCGGGELNFRRAVFSADSKYGAVRCVGGRACASRGGAGLSGARARPRLVGVQVGAACRTPGRAGGAGWGRWCPGRVTGARHPQSRPPRAGARCPPPMTPRAGREGRGGRAHVCRRARRRAAGERPGRTAGAEWDSEPPRGRSLGAAGPRRRRAPPAAWGKVALASGSDSGRRPGPVPSGSLRAPRRGS